MRAISDLSLEQIGLQKIREMHASLLNTDCQGLILIAYIGLRIHTYTLHIHTCIIVE